MSISEKIKAIHNKVEQNKAQYDLYGQIAKISALSSGDLINMNFNWKICFSRKRLARKSWSAEKI